MTKPTKWHVRPAKTQISLGIRPVWSEYSLSSWRKFGSLATHWAHSEDSGQTGRMPRLIWVFAGRICHFVGFVMRKLIFVWKYKYERSMPRTNCVLVCSIISAWVIQGQLGSVPLHLKHRNTQNSNCNICSDTYLQVSYWCSANYKYMYMYMWYDEQIFVSSFD